MNATSLQTDAPNFEAILAAQQRIAPRIHRTPVVTSVSLDQIAGARLYFKCENLQKTGSFKIRGATNAVFSLTDEEARQGVVAPSSGNHAAALALAARCLLIHRRQKCERWSLTAERSLSVNRIWLRVKAPALK
jgi:threonine dehydratase